MKNILLSLMILHSALSFSFTHNESECERLAKIHYSDYRQAYLAIDSKREGLGEFKKVRSAKTENGKLTCEFLYYLPRDICWFGYDLVKAVYPIYDHAYGSPDISIRYIEDEND